MTKQDPAEDRRLFLLDAFALIYRAYFAFSATKMVNSKGVNTSPVFGFAITLLDLLEKEKPTHIAVVFDVGAETIRTTQFAAYKANRAETPEDIRTAVPYIQRLIEGFRIPVIGLAGYEADDLIGTLAKKAERHGYTTYMVTPDKDYGQLVSDKIFMYKPGKKGNTPEVLGPKEVCAKYGIERPVQVIDILGMWGDAVDNIPGIPGVGEKTAIKLVQEYGSVENLIANSANLKGKLKESVEQFANQGLLSKKLATIIIDAPIDLDEGALILEEPDRDKLKELFSELEFRSLSRRVLGEEAAVSQAVPASRPKQADTPQMDLFGSGGATEAETSTPSDSGYRTIKTGPHDYILADTADKRRQLLGELMTAAEICFDTETTDLDTLGADIVGASFAIKEGQAWYVPFPEGKQGAKEMLMEFAALWNDATRTIVGQNLKYDIGILDNYGIALKGRLYDTMLAHYLVQPDMRHGMDLLAETYLGYKTVSISALIGKKGKEQGSMRDVPVEHIKDYAAEDADITLRLKHVFDSMLDEAGARQLFNEVEMPLVPVLSAMEREGIRFDSDALKVLSKELESDIVLMQDAIHALAGVPFNLNSPRQLGEVLFDHLKIDPSAKKTGKSGQYATSEEVLQKLADRHPIVSKMRDYRGLQKLKSTYVDVLPTLVNPRTGRIHTSFNQAVAATGRLSSNNPNLQNIPIRTERGREVRKAFVPRDENFVLLSADYSQIELRVIASLSGDQNMMEAFRSDQDIHAATAAKVFGVPLADVTRDQRGKAKAVNFGIIYGQSAFGLAENLGISRTEAREIIDSYFVQYPGIRRYMDASIASARKLGYVQTMLGRRRYLRDINSNNPTVRGFAERNAINAPIQGSAADMIKVAMIRVHAALREQDLRSRLLLQVHDELVLDAHRTELGHLTALVTDCMSKAIPLKVPVVVSTGVGQNWLEAH